MFTCDICLLNHHTNDHYKPEFAPIKIEAMPEPTREQTNLLIEYWHTSKAHSHSRYERMQYVTRWFVKKYPVKPTIAYKWLDRAIAQ